MTTNHDKVMYSVVADSYYLDSIDNFVNLLVSKTREFTYPEHFEVKPTNGSAPLDKIEKSIKEGKL